MVEEENKFQDESAQEASCKPFGEIKSRVEDIIDNFVGKKFRDQVYDAKQA